MAKNTNILFVIIFLVFIFTIMFVGAEINVSSCMQLNTSDTYKLNQSFSATENNCLYITNVSATLDCQNNIIDGQNTYSSLIKADKGVNISNCVLYNWNGTGMMYNLQSTTFDFFVENITFNDTSTGGTSGRTSQAIYSFKSFSANGNERWNNIQHILPNNPTYNCYSFYQGQLSGTENLTISNSVLPCGIQNFYIQTTNFNLTNVTGEVNKSIIAMTLNQVIQDMDNLSQIIISANGNISNITFNRTTYNGPAISLTQGSNMIVSDIKIYNGGNGIIFSGNGNGDATFKNIYLENVSNYGLWHPLNAYGNYIENFTFIHSNYSGPGALWWDHGSGGGGTFTLNNSKFYINFSDDTTNAYAVFINPDTVRITSIYNNYFNINNGVYYKVDSDRSSASKMYLNTSLQTGTRIFGSGTKIGGNYYTNPTSTGNSDTCADTDFNGICDSTLSFGLLIGGLTVYDYLPLSDNYDVTNPVWSSNSITSASRKYGETVNFQVTLTDNYLLRNYTFGWNDTTVWINNSLVSLSTNSTTVSVDKTITSKRGTSVCWQFYFGDYYGNLNQTDITCFTVNDTVPVSNLTFISPSPATVLDNLTCNWTGYDVDNDTVNITTTNWTINGVVNVNHNNTLPGGTLLGNDTVQCLVLLNDGYENASIWGTAPAMAMTDVLPPAISNLPNSIEVFTDETKRLNITCIDPEGSGIANGYPLISYVDPDGLTQGNYSMSSAGSGVFYYQSTFSKVGLYNNFKFVCMDAQSHSSDANGTFNITSGLRPSNSAPPGAGGVVVVSSNAVQCDWKFDKNSIVFGVSDTAKRLVLINNENFSVNPKYQISGDVFTVAGQKQILSSKSQTELTILKQKTYLTNKSINETLTISSPECIAITANIRYEYEEQKITSYQLGNLIITKLISKVDLFGFGVKFYWFTILSIIIVSLIVWKSRTGIFVKILGGIVMVIIVNILLAAALSDGDALLATVVPIMFIRRKK